MNYLRSREMCSVMLLVSMSAAGCTAWAEDEGTTETETMTEQTKHAHTNRLVDSTSPYLLQHAHNPVNWFPWGPEAFEKAKAENKPVFLSIGYAACHWCHVMEHESFENEALAVYLNEHFVSIKVDREERPDVDEIYMHVTQQMTGHGGWPMTVFMTHDKVPFFAGTYFPRAQFRSLLEQLHNAWTSNHDQIIAQGKEISTQVARWAKGPPPSAEVISQSATSHAATTLARYFDRDLGGMSGGGTNKFPPSMAMDLMLREYSRSGNDDLLFLVELTLDQMARGGIYDHLGGGICRYSTDKRWLVPHFEKMLYDQALNSAVYLDAHQVTGKTKYARTAADIFDYVIEDLQSPGGGFYSTRDADSEGMEGAFYIWTVEQVNEVLGAEDGALFCEFYNVTPNGNWFESRGHAPKGPKNILNVIVPLEKFAERRKLDPIKLDASLASMRDKLLQVRSKRVPPALDDKILTGWNGLMIASMAKGARVLNQPKYAVAAGRAADFVLKELRKDGRLLRSYRGGKAHLTGYLSDYSFLIEGLINLYEATFEKRWLDEAVALNDMLIRHYHDTQGGAFFFTADDGEELLARTKNPHDGAIPSGNSVQAMNLLRLAILLDRKDYRAKAEGIFKAFKPMAERSAGAFERLLCAVDFYYGQPKEIALIGPKDSAQLQELVRALYVSYLPNKVVAWAEGNAKEGESAIALLKLKKQIKGKPTAYVCQDYRCKKPVHTAEDLADQLLGN